MPHTPLPCPLPSRVAATRAPLPHVPPQLAARPGAGRRLAAAALAAALLAAAPPALAARRPALPAGATPAAVQGTAQPPAQPEDAIVAVVDGEPVTRSDVTARARLFALSTGLPMAPDVLERLRPQITRQLIDERLRAEEIQRRKIVVPDQDVANAIVEIEKRNNLPPGALRAKLEDEGVATRTLFDQIRTQIGWTRVLREQLGRSVQPSDADVAEAQRQGKAQSTQPQYRLSEIFIPVEDPARAPEAQRFADTVIGQLRQGAPFPVVAAQFSQSQTALEGGDLGWKRLDQFDPPVSAVVRDMPAGAVSNPIRVPGGIIIVTLRAKRESGRDSATVDSLRQAFFPFSSPLDPHAPTPQQQQMLQAATQLSRSAHECSQIEAANKGGSAHPSDPGPVMQDAVNPQMHALLVGLQPGQATHPLVAPDGIIVMMLCSREVKVAGDASRQQVAEDLVQSRVELASRQLQRDLRRKALIDQRS